MLVYERAQRLGADEGHIAGEDEQGGVCLAQTEQRGTGDAVFAARDIWHSINRPNLIDNILPTRPRATLVLRKDADHAINRLRLRKQ